MVIYTKIFSMYYIFISLRDVNILLGTENNNNGPKFAVTPIINEELLHRVQVDVAECAYKLKWNRHIEEGNGNTATNVQTSAAAPSPEPEPEPEVQDTRIPFKSPFATPPPNQNIILEAELSMLNKHILDTYNTSRLN